MGWSNLVYLLAGLGLGIGSKSLLTAIRTDRQRSKHPEPAIATSKRKKGNLKTCLEQLQQTRLAYQMASEMSAFKAGFLGRVSHELRSPLNGMIGMHQLILEDLCDSPAEEREFVAKAHESALKLMKFIDEIVLVSKTEHGTEKQEIEPIKLAGIFQEVYRLTKQQAANRNLDLQVVTPPPDIYVLADRRRLRQILVNLVDSAITPQTQGRIRLSAHPDPERSCARILLEDRRPASFWSDPVDLLTSSPSIDVQSNSKPTSGLTLMANDILLELMQGSLEVLAVPSPADSTSVEAASNLSRIQCTIPLAIPESE